MNIKKIIKEELLKEQVVCHLISPRGNGNGGYMSNEETLELIKKIWESGRKEITDKSKLQTFRKTLQNFKKDIIRVDTNNDTIDTYLHKLRDLVGCYSLH